MFFICSNDLSVVARRYNAQAVARRSHCAEPTGRHRASKLSIEAAQRSDTLRLRAHLL
jgi:hypothetical protein